MPEQILGDYQILKQIGAGTLGVVLLAEHRFIKKHYALKVLPAELSQDRAFIERFEAEITKIAYLEHPNIVKIHHVSFVEGLYFLVTDCVVDAIGETTNLAQYMFGRKERLKEEELLTILHQIAEALDYAHTKGGIFHRALKLNNVLIGKTNPNLEILISDFGLANIISASKSIPRIFYTVANALGALPLEEGGHEKYSPFPIDTEKLNKLSSSFLQAYAFLAPEQKRFEHVGVHADSFAFGVMAYFLIAGEFPEGLFEMPSQIAPEYRYDWDWIISQCLNQDPKRRPSQLLPLLEKKKPREQTQLKTPIIEASQLHEVLTSPSYVQPIVDSLKTPVFRSVASEEIKREETDLKPLIQRSKEDILQPIPLQEPIPSPVAVVVESKDVAEATPPPITPEKDEHYSTQLNSMLNREPVVTQYQPEKKEARHIEPLQTEMVVIQGGRFFRGSNSGSRDEMPCHQILVDSFAVDIHPVTNEQFLRFLEYMGGEKDQNYHDLIRLKDSRIARSGGRLTIESGYAKHPVVGVTWYGAVAYAKWVGKRLPTEAEWEIAARGGKENCMYPTGGNIEKNQANFFSSDTTAVMSYAPNGYGIYDIVGNVYEWCQDWYGYTYYETSVHEPQNPKGPIQGVYRVLRGGCWKSLPEDLRASHRHRNNPGTVNSTYGFRCAADVC